MIPYRLLPAPTSFPYSALVLIAIQLAWFVYQSSLASAGESALLQRFSLSPLELHQWWQEIPNQPVHVLLSLWTGLFLNHGTLHLLLNVWGLWLFGDHVESRQGHYFFMVFFCCCGGLAWWADVFLHPQSSLPLLGSQGAVAAILGANLWSCRRHHIEWLVPLPFVGRTFRTKVLWAMLLWWGLACLLAWEQYYHLLAGALAGFLLSPCFGKKS